MSYVLAVLAFGVIVFLLWTLQLILAANRARRHPRHGGRTMTIAERVAAGAALLDEHRPGWDGQIDLERLSLPSTCDCILGQIFPDTDDGDDGYWAGLADHDLGILTSDRACALGFASDYGYKPLEAEWTRVITERRAAS